MPELRHILPRHLSAELQDALTWSRVVNVVGPRQAGKTTLVRDILQTGHFITLDDETVLEAIENDPWGPVAAPYRGSGSRSADHRRKRSAPEELPLAIKRIVDTRQPSTGQFVLTGSSNMFRTQHVADSLAGRMLTLTLWPLTVAETISQRSVDTSGLGPVPIADVDRICRPRNR